jgi:branched-chain amino acid transport system ATP-binding protein
VSLSVEAGTLTGLIGPNGAGKTTWIDAVSGFVPSTGRVRFDGTDVGDWRPDRRSRAGLVRTWQSVELFDDLTVEENCRVAAGPLTGARLLDDLVRPSAAGASRAADDPVAWALAEVGLAAVAARRPEELSLGQRKLAGVARALASGPSLVLLDEPAAGLDTAESAELGATLRRLVDGGLTIVLVDHDMGLVLSVCDHVHVLDFGRLIAQGPPATVRRDERVVEAYLGTRAGS